MRIEGGASTSPDVCTPSVPIGGRAAGGRLGGALRDAAAQAVVAVVLAGRGDDPLPIDRQADGAADRTATRALIDAAAAGLAPRDRTLLLLSAAGPHTGGELAAAVGVPRSQIYMVLNRMRQRAWRSMAAAVLVEVSAPPGCPPLRSVLDGCPDDFSPLVRKRVARHLDRCPACRAEARRRIADAVDEVAER